MSESRSTRSDLIAGARSVLPMLVGVIPFGLVAGATPVAAGLDGDVAVGLSTLVFAGASQLAAADVLADGGTALVAILAACTINLRLLLYSASLAPFVAGAPMRTRLLMAYVLTDQAYAVSINRWSATPSEGLNRKLPFYFGAAFLLWANWQVCTVVGVLIGNAIPKSLPLQFAVPLVFLVLLVPTIVTRPAIVAAAVGGVSALLAAEFGAGHLGVLVGALAGIAAGATTEAAVDRRDAPDTTPLPPDPSAAP